MTNDISLRVAMAYHCVEMFREELKPAEWEQCAAGNDDPDSFCDSNMVVADAYEAAFGYAPSSLFGSTREAEVCANWNGAVRLASRLIVGETFSVSEAEEIVAADDPKGLAIVGGGRRLLDVAREFGLIR